MIVANAIHKSYPTAGEPLVVLHEVSLALQAGQSAAIVGPSGSGKSTLLNILGTLEPPTTGRITLDGVDPYTLPERQLAKFRNERIGFVFQEHHLLPQCSVLENVLLPTLAWPGRDDALIRGRNLVEAVGLTARDEHRPAELSGGERQRVALARALINRPSLVLADEPTGNLDRANGERVGAMLMELSRHEGVTLVVVTHSRALAERFDKRYELIDGSLTVL